MVSFCALCIVFNTLLLFRFRNELAEASAREPVRVTVPERVRESLDGAISTNPITNRNHIPAIKMFLPK